MRTGTVQQTEVRSWTPVKTSPHPKKAPQPEREKKQNFQKPPAQSAQPQLRQKKAWSDDRKDHFQSNHRSQRPQPNSIPSEQNPNRTVPRLMSAEQNSRQVSSVTGSRANCLPQMATCPLPNTAHGTRRLAHGTRRLALMNTMLLLHLPLHIAQLPNFHRPGLPTRTLPLAPGHRQCVTLHG